MRKFCKVSGCERKHYGLGFCSMHYSRHRSGSLLEAPEIRTTLSSPAIFLLRTLVVDTDECIYWSFAKTKGVAVITIDGKSHYAPRLVCEIKNGPPPSSQHVAAHSCGHGHLGCVNWKHMRWATKKENQEDRKLHGTHLVGSQLPHTKLTEENVQSIKSFLARGEKQKDIASRFGVSQGLISAISLKKVWAHIQ